MCCSTTRTAVAYWRAEIRPWAGGTTCTVLCFEVLRPELVSTQDKAYTVIQIIGCREINKEPAFPEPTFQPLTIKTGSVGSPADETKAADVCPTAETSFPVFIGNDVDGVAVGPTWPVIDHLTKDVAEAEMERKDWPIENDRQRRMFRVNVFFIRQI